MAFLTFTPVYAPSPGTSDSPKLKILKAEFGDGYSQSVPDGINHIRRVLDLTWEILLPNDCDDITNFFIARKGCEPFWWTPSDELVALKWTCSDWKVKRGESGVRTIDAKFEQSFLV